MTACPSAEHLRRFLSEQLSGPEEGTLTTHVEKCVGCQARLEELTQVARRAGAPPESPHALPSAFLERLRHVSLMPEDGAPNRDTHASSATISHLGASPPLSPEWPAVPGYEILGELGRGGMGVVYKARQLGFNRVVALKMILDGAHASAEQRARFRREAEAAARLQHPHIVQVHDVGEQEGRLFFSMEYVAGGSLAQKLSGTPQEPRLAATLLQALVRAIQHAHEQGIIHRDLKPANILLQPLATKNTKTHEKGGESEPASDSSFCASSCFLWPFLPKITDFGLAKHLPAEALAAGNGMTHSGAILGSPSYMAPEQASGQGQTAGPAADVYALGAILYELLTGRPPFKAVTPVETLVQVMHEEPVAPRRLVHAIPRDLETICLKCLEKAPGRRYASAEALAEDLRRYLNGEPILARPAPAWERALKWTRRRPALASLIVVCVLAFAGVAAAWQRAAKQRTLALDKLEQSVNLTIEQLVLLRTAYQGGQPDVAYHRTQAVGRATAFFEGILAEDHPSEERFRRLRGRVHNGLGMTHLVAGNPAQAVEHYRKAEVLQKALMADYPAQPEYRVDLALTYDGLAEAYRMQGQAQEAEAASSKALDLFASLPPDHVRLAHFVAPLAQALFNHGKVQEALPWQGRLIEQLEALEAKADKPSQRTAYRSVLRDVYMARALALMMVGRPLDALPDWDRTGELDETQPPVRWRLWRAGALAMSGQHARAAEEMTAFAAKGWLAGPTLADQGYGGALADVALRVYGECRAAVLRDEGLPTAERDRLAEECSVRLVELLGKGRDAGLYKDPKARDQLRKEPTLAFLQERADFQAFLKSLEE